MSIDIVNNHRYLLYFKKSHRLLPFILPVPVAKTGLKPLTLGRRSKCSTTVLSLLTKNNHRFKMLDRSEII
jgi:hypothetical protein